MDRRGGDAQRLADSYFEPLMTCCVNTELVHVEDRSQGLVGVGSRAEDLEQGPERRLDGWGSHRVRYIANIPQPTDNVNIRMGRIPATSESCMEEKSLAEVRADRGWNTENPCLPAGREDCRRFE